MNITKLSTTVLIPSGFALPMNGHAVDATRGCATTTVIPTDVVRDRGAVLVPAGMGSAQAYFPGTRAWRPPSC